MFDRVRAGLLFSVIVNEVPGTLSGSQMEQTVSWNDTGTRRCRSGKVQITAAVVEISLMLMSLQRKGMIIRR